MIKTHHGLFRYTRLPYGVSSTPGLLQKVIEQMLRGIPGVAVYTLTTSWSLDLLRLVPRDL